MSEQTPNVRTLNNTPPSERRANPHTPGLRRQPDGTWVLSQLKDTPLLQKQSDGMFNIVGFSFTTAELHALNVAILRELAEQGGVH